MKTKLHKIPNEVTHGINQCTNLICFCHEYTLGLSTHICSRNKKWNIYQSFIFTTVNVTIFVFSVERKLHLNDVHDDTLFPVGVVFSSTESILHSAKRERGKKSTSNAINQLKVLLSQTQIRWTIVENPPMHTLFHHCSELNI